MIPADGDNIAPQKLFQARLVELGHVTGCASTFPLARGIDVRGITERMLRSIDYSRNAESGRSSMFKGACGFSPRTLSATVASFLAT